MNSQESSYPWRLFFFLLLGSLLGVLAVLPYLSVILQSTLASKPLPLPLPLLALIQGLTNFGIAAGLGILLARKVGLGAPILEGWLYGRPIRAPRRMIAIACLTGVALGAITVALAHSRLGAPLAALSVVSEGAIPLWKRLLACFYGGLCEEVLMRLFLLSLVIWLFVKFRRTEGASRSPAILWSANILVAIAFGAGHLPLAAQLTTLTPSLVTAVIALNAIPSLGFGYLYWTGGLEAAMLAHFSADIVLHVLGPSLFSSL